MSRRPTTTSHQLTIGQPVRYRARRLIRTFGARGRSRLTEAVLFGWGILRGCSGLYYDVERADGTLVRIDGVGLYAHELAPCEAPP